MFCDDILVGVLLHVSLAMCVLHSCEHSVNVCSNGEEQIDLEEEEIEEIIEIPQKTEKRESM